MDVVEEQPLEQPRICDGCGAFHAAVLGAQLEEVNGSVYETEFCPHCLRLQISTRLRSDQIDTDRVAEQAAVVTDRRPRHLRAEFVDADD